MTGDLTEHEKTNEERGGGGKKERGNDLKKESNTKIKKSQNLCNWKCETDI